MIYSQYLKTQYWQTTRTRIIDIKGKGCKFCEDEERPNIHHKIYNDNNGSILFREQNHHLIPLCAKHHRLWHATYGYRQIKPMDYVRGKLLLKLGATDKQAVLLCTNRTLGIDFLRKQLLLNNPFPIWGMALRTY